MKTVLITGASTGIGAAAARHLAAKGWCVFAGVRKAADGEALTAGAEGEVLKLLCALTTPMDLLDEGLDVLDAAAAAAQGKRTGPGANGHAARTTAEGMEVWL